MYMKPYAKHKPNITVKPYAKLAQEISQETGS